MMENPFGVYNPEQLDADYIAKNFVDIYTDLPRLEDPINTFILGARGTGKSMLLRSLEPEVMLKIERADNLRSLPYFSVHVPLKKAEFAVPELQRLAGYAGVAVGEHLLTMQVMYRILISLRRLSHEITFDEAQNFLEFFVVLFSACGGDINVTFPHKFSSTTDILKSLEVSCERAIVAARQFYSRLPFLRGQCEYSGALTTFLDFLIPCAREIRKFKELPDVPLYIMLDDADNLPQQMQKIVNSWVSTRSTSDICLKITTQLGYATLRTVDDRVVESPHDFIEINLSTIYTRELATYSNRVREIVVRRLRNAGIARDVNELFPCDEAQAARLRQIELTIRAEREAEIASGQTSTGSSRVRDAVARYAVPRLMRELAGSSRSSHTYSYAGFQSIVDLSSGVIRWFLEPASRMYDEVVSSNGGQEVAEIPVSTQDAVLLDWSKEFLNRLDNRPDAERSSSHIYDPEASLHAQGHETELYGKLRNLLEGLGQLFRQKLMTEDASEQRLFSFIMQDKPSNELKDVLGLAVRLGYLQLSDYASKEAYGGRVPRYILARRLGPYFRLDVSGYAAHLSVLARDLEVAMNNPANFVARRLRQHPSRASQMVLELVRVNDGAAH